MPNTVNYTVQQRAIHARLCGHSVVAGGTYISIAGSSDASGLGEIEIGNFIIDPVLRIQKEFGLSAIGMQLRPRTDEYGIQEIGSNGKPIFDLWDWIGATQYPNTLDWIYECMHFGFHRILPPNLPFGMLSEESEYYAVHSRAWIEYPAEYYSQWKRDPQVTWKDCPLDIQLHKDGNLDGTCPGIFAQDIVDFDAVVKDRLVRRDGPELTYYGFKTIDNYIKHEPGAFLKLPIGYMAEFLVYEDPETNKHEAALTRLADLKASLQKVVVIPWEADNGL